MQRINKIPICTINNGTIFFLFLWLNLFFLLGSMCNMEVWNLLPLKLWRASFYKRSLELDISMLSCKTSKVSNVYGQGDSSPKLVIKVSFWWYVIERWMQTWHSSEFDQNALKELVECNPHESTQKLALDLNTFPIYNLLPLEKKQEI